MKLPESLFSRMLLAYLPFMVYPYGFMKAGVAALWIVVFLWFTVAFFWLTRRLFPERFLKHAFFLWLIVWAQALWTLTKLPPYWIVSVFFLTPVSFLEDAARSGPNTHPSKRSGDWGRPGRPSRKEMKDLDGRVRVFSREVPRDFFERALAGAGFAGFVALLALVRETGETYLGIQAFGQPAGMLLGIAAFAFLWKNLSYRGKAPIFIERSKADIGAAPVAINKKKKRPER